METEISQETKPENREETGRNEDGTFKKGISGNPGGRKKNPIKDFSLDEFNNWTIEQKREFLAKIAPIDRWKMTEGNPKQDIDQKSEETVKHIISIDE